MTKNIALALVEAQKNMTKAAKQANNPHFRTKYADLGNVMDACLPALNDAGIALIQPSGEDESGRYVETILVHGESGEQLSCKVPLIVQKNDMQGYGSAVTYARRYGLMTMAGIAPEDDDGNAASKAPPRQQERKPRPKQDNRPEPPKISDDDRTKNMEEALRGCESLEDLNKLWNMKTFKGALGELEPKFGKQLTDLYNSIVDDGF